MLGLCFPYLAADQWSKLALVFLSFSVRFLFQIISFFFLLLFSTCVIYLHHFFSLFKFHLIHFPRTILFTDRNIHFCAPTRIKHTIESNHTREYTAFVHMYVDRFLPIILWFLWNKMRKKRNQHHTEDEREIKRERDSRCRE